MDYVEPLRVSWENFRGFDRETRFDLPAVTLFIGRNNVGKSSAYAPLLAMRQTLDARDPKTALLSRGELLDIGSYREYVSRHEVHRNITLQLSIPPVSNIPERPHRPIGGLRVTFDSEDGSNSRLYRHTVLDRSNRALVTRTRERDGQAFSVASPLLPSAVSVGRPLKEVTELRRGMREEQPTGFLFDGFGGLLVPRGWREDEDRWKKVRRWFNAASEIFDVYGELNQRLRSLLLNISYLGPLRSLPQRTYRLAAETPSEVGREGQYAPEILFRGRDTMLREQVDKWLGRLGYGSLEFTELGEEYFQVSIRSQSNLVVNIAHSGVGLSQLLPLLVQGLNARKDALLIAQQPEIHLNPAQQCIFLDFLVELASSGRRVLIETHSEHVLLRLRRRIAEKAISSSDTAVYYFGKDDQRGLSVRRVELGEGGDIDRRSWPEGFFEEQLTDSFALAIAQSRRLSQ